MRRIGLWMQCDVRLKRKKRKKEKKQEKKRNVSQFTQ